MPSFFSDVLDDTPVFDASSSFEGGQRSNVRANLLNTNEVALLQNFDITRTGELITRRGSTRLGGTVDTSFGIVKGLTFYDTPTNSYAVAGTASGPRYYNGSSWPQLSVGNPIGVSGLSANDVSFAQGVNTLYMVDGYNGIYSWDGTTSTLVSGAANDEGPVGPRYAVWHTNRLAVGCLGTSGVITEGDTIYFSQFLEGDVWDKASWNVRVGAGEGDRITGMVSWTDFNLAVFKERSVWVVDCDPNLEPAQFQIKPVTRSVGCPAGKTAVQVGDDILFLSTQGVRSVKRTLASEQQQDIGPALSEPITDLIARINPAAIARSAAIHWNNRYILSVPLDSATTPNYCIVFNTLTNTWSGFWTGWQAKYFSSRVVTSGQPARMIFENNAFIHEWLDYVNVADEAGSTFQDNGTDIACRVLTRAMTFSEPLSPKTGLSCEVEYTTAGSNLTAQLVKDGTNAGSPVTLSSSQTRKAFDVQSIGQFRELQLDINSTAGKQKLRSVIASAFIDPLALAS